MQEDMTVTSQSPRGYLWLEQVTRMASCIFPKQIVKAAVCNSVNTTACIYISSSVCVSKIYCILNLEFAFKAERFTLKPRYPLHAASPLRLLFLHCWSLHQKRKQTNKQTRQKDVCHYQEIRANPFNFSRRICPSWAAGMSWGQWRSLYCSALKQ